MKSRNLIALFFVAVFSILLIPACKKDRHFIPDGDPIPVTIPEEESELYGVRLVIDSLKCVEETDSGPEEEFYGYIEVWVEYEDDYQKTAENYETTDRALMWFADRDNYIPLKEGESTPIGEVIDFIFNKDYLHKAKIHLKVHLNEYDGNDDDILWDSVSWSVGGLLLGEGQDFELGIFHSGGWTRAAIIYSLEKFDGRSSGILPPGEQPSGEFEIGTYPKLPTPSRYEDRPPAISEKLIVGQKKWDNFHPEPLQARTVDNVNNLGKGPFYVYGLRELNSMPIFVEAGAPNLDPEVRPVKNSKGWYGLFDIVDDPRDCRFIETVQAIEPLASSPRLQLSRYYKPVEAWRLPAGASKTIKVEYYKGWEKEFHIEFSLTVGFSGDIFSSELTSTFGSSWSFSGSVTDSEELSYTAPEDKNVLYVVWQLYEEYRMINDEGNNYTDPNYQFRSMEGVSIPTNHIVPKAYLFDAQ